ncbi:BTB/POZ and MATH domain-containing protein 4 [Vitis vinifera]|uniref:BTB/POZ and MATH domain-containing protein 4 n=1 Tax=Vitis vinifera TaxID=29760 RepID=A0A438DI71_VITVI|nr:BTB/POZ and MATH domain-containing protein 4 [Vitis vinifera]
MLESSDFLKDDCLKINCTVGVVVSAIDCSRLHPIQFHAHKLVLAARSPIFESEFINGPEDDKQEIVVEDMDPKQAVLHFIYRDSLIEDEELLTSGSSCMVSESDTIAAKLLAAADKYGLTRLRLMCEALLCKDISVNSVSKILALADRYHATDLKAVCLKFAAENLVGIFLSMNFYLLEEIYAALMGMNGDKKAPGQDGLTIAFWQSRWELVKEEIMELFREFYDQCSFAKSLNSTFIVLIPKKGGAEDLGDFRPISLLRVMINGVPAGFFSNSKGLRQGDPLSPYLFVLGMEVLSNLIRRAVDGGFLSGCRIRGRGEEEMIVSHLLFADDTIIFCEASKEQLSALSWILAWFEVASGLRINLDKSVLIPVGEVEDIEEMAVELGCKVGLLPTVYLGLPLGAHHKAVSIWDGSVVNRLEKLQRDFLWGGDSLERKVHLINWEVVCTQREKGGLGIRKIDSLNKALLGKWVWRFAVENDNLWRLMIGVKYGQEEFGWRTKEARGTYGVGVWKEIMKEAKWCWENIKFKVGKGTRVKFWSDQWCGNERLSHSFPQLYEMAVNRNATVNEMWDHSSGQGGWNLRFHRDFNDWELDLIRGLLIMLRDFKLSSEEDMVLWKGGGGEGGAWEVWGEGCLQRAGCYQCLRLSV